MFRTRMKMGTNKITATATELNEIRGFTFMWKTECTNKYCKHGNNCHFICPSKSPVLCKREQVLNRVSTIALASYEENHELREQVKALRAQNKALRAQNKSPSKKSGKKSSGAGAAAVDNEVYPSASTLSRIIYDILSDGNYMTCARVGQAVMKHRDNPSRHTLKKMFFHLRKNNEIEGSPKSATKYISSLANVVEGEKSGTLKTFGLSVQEEDALGALFESAAPVASVAPAAPSAPATLDGEWPVAEVSLGALLESVAPAAPVLKPKDSDLDVLQMGGIKTDGN